MKEREGPWPAPFLYPLLMDLVICFQPVADQKVEVAGKSMLSLADTHAGAGGGQQVQSRGSEAPGRVWDFQMHHGPAHFVTEACPGSL